LITAKLEPQGDAATKVTVSTDLTITGKVAQFGRGALADVSTRLLGQFVTQLESTVLNEQIGTAGNGTAEAAAADAEAAPAPSADAPPAASTGETGVRKIAQPEAQPIDLLDAAGAPLAKRLIPVGIVVIVLLLLLRRHRRSS
jgi:hypothetical protein